MSLKYLNKDGLSYFWQKIKARFTNIEKQLPSTISGVPVNTTTGAMELYSYDLNEVTVTGFYNAMTCTNAKYTYSTLIVIGYYLPGYCTQIQTDVTTGIMAMRQQVNYSWTAWKEIDMSAFYTKTETDTALADKVDKVSGKGLSTNDYTTEDKNKLDALGYDLDGGAP